MSQQAKHGMHAVLTGVAFFFIIIAVSYVWSQINVKGQQDRVIDVEIGVEEQAVNDMLKEAYQLRSKGQSEEAIAQFQSILKQHPNTNQKPTIQFYMATCYSKIGKPEKAIELYKQIIAESPDYPQMATVLYNLALAYEWTKNTEAALATYDQIANTWPHTDTAAHALFTKGQFYYYQRQFDEAQALFEKVVDDEQNPSKKWKLVALERIGLAHLELKEYEQAVTTFEEKLRVFGQNAFAAHMVAEAYRRNAQYPEAITAFKKILSEYPDYKEAHVAAYFFGECLERQGNLQEAKTAYQEAITQYPQVATEAQHRIEMIQQGQDPLVTIKE